MEANICESDVSRLCFGKVSKYFNDKGYGFIKQIYPADQSTRDVFFHINKVKHLNINDKLNYLANGIPETNVYKDMFFWYVPEITHKGLSVLKCWLDIENIDSDCVINFIRYFQREILEFRQNDDINTSLCNNNDQYNEDMFTDTPEEYYRILLLDADKIDYNFDESIDYSSYYTGITFNDSCINIIDNFDSFRSYTYALPHLKFSKSHDLTNHELAEAIRWVRIYIINKFNKHFEVNEFITKHDLWDEFTHIRSFNDHNMYKNIRGIKPKIYKAVCNEFGVSGNNGLPLTSYKEY